MNWARWSAVVALVIVIGCGRAPFSFENARKVFEDTLSDRYKNQFRLLDWRTTNTVLTISEPADLRTYAVAYELECLSGVDIAGLLGNRSYAQTEDSTKRVVYLTGGYQKTPSGFRLVKPLVEHVTCALGQRISFEGEVTFQRAHFRWQFYNQEPFSFPFDTKLVEPIVNTSKKAGSTK